MVEVETNFVKSLRTDIYFEALRKFPHENYGHTSRDFVEIRQKMINHAAKRNYDSSINWHKIYQIVTKSDYTESDEETVPARVSKDIFAYFDKFRYSVGFKSG